MARRNTASKQQTTETADEAVSAGGWMARWWGKLLLILLGTIFLTLSYAPSAQFYAAWMGLVPWLLVVAHCSRQRAVFFWSWLAGTFYFAANLWWLVWITGPGVVALTAVMGLFWPVVGMVLWPVLRKALLSPRRIDFVAVLLLVPTVWVASEWVRGGFPFEGLAWLYLAHSQIPALVLCQIADATGELGVSFWVAMINGLVLIFLLRGWKIRPIITPGVITAVTLAFVAAYGSWRFAEAPGAAIDGPTVLLVQPNYPQDNSTGEKGTTPDDIVNFHAVKTQAALTAAAQTGGNQPDLVAWSETMMPPLNPEARASWKQVQQTLAAEGFDLDDLPGTSDKIISTLAQRYKAGFIVGSSYVQQFRILRNPQTKKVHLSDEGRRNSAFLYQRETGVQAGRFDKIHTVPFGEYIPFKEGWPWLYRQLISFGPANMESYQLTAGDKFVVFNLPMDRINGSTDPKKNWRFVTPICFEDTDGPLVAQMIRAGRPRGDLPDGKAADLIVNLTNDGWFGPLQPHQHLQVAAFRSIENRVPTARSVNTGVSAVIDSMGRVTPDGFIRAGTEGTLIRKIQLDSRTTFYTKWGSILGPLCGWVTAGFALVTIGGWLRRRKSK